MRKDLFKGASFVLFSLILCSSCAPTLIGAVAYKTSKTREQKQQFLKNFNEMNLEREKAGLPPLDLCTEKYHFDEKWAKEDPECKKRIEAYEAGDKTALGTSQLSNSNKKSQENK